MKTYWLDELDPEEIASLEDDDDSIIELLWQEETGDIDEASGGQMTGRKAWVVRKGKKVRIGIKRRPGRLSSKQKAALRKARRKSQTGTAKLKRKMSGRIRKRLSIKKTKGGSRPKGLSINR